MLSFLNSCGPDWAANDGFSFLYNCSLMVFGFLIPTAVVAICNISVLMVSLRVCFVGHIFLFKCKRFFCIISINI